MSDQATLEFYAREAPTYTLSGIQGPSRFLDPFLDQLGPGVRVLELGCGGGRDSARIAARGFALDATDGVAAMAAKAKERHSINARVLRFDELDAIEAYDAVWAHAALHHQPLAGLGDVLQRIARATRPGGLFFANYKLGQGDARDMFGRLYNFAPRARLLALYAEAGWQIEAIEDYRDGGLDKVMRDWIALTMRRPG